MMGITRPRRDVLIAFGPHAHQGFGLILRAAQDVENRSLTNHRLGPTDYSRSSQLADIEKALSDPSAFEGMETQRVTEALLAAKLSRGLELPRTETDGRFARVVRLADQDGKSGRRRCLI